MDWKFWAPMIATVLQTLVTIIWFRLQLRKWNLEMAPAKVQEANKKSRFGQYWPILAMLVVMIGSWTPYFIASQASENALMSWGPNGPVGAKWPIPGTPPQLMGTINGRLLLAHRSTHHVGLVAYHSLGTIEVEDVRDLQKSSLFEIRDDTIRIVLSLNDAFMAEVAKGYVGTGYAALLVPNGVRMEDFQTLREAHNLGVTDVGGGIGPP